MPATVSHALSMTTPNDPAWECQPQHWNSNHNITLAAVGSEISGAFANSPTVSFGLSAGSITASANVTAAPSPVNVTGANGSSVNAQTIQFDNANGMTLGVSTAANGATVTGSYTVPAVPTSYVSRVNGSSGAISLNVGSSLSASTNGSSITFGLASDITTALQSAGAYLTTAAQSNQIVNSINGSIGTFSFNVGSSLSVSTAARNITFGLASNITTALQSAGAYLTTARASNDAIGLNSALTANGVSMTANSAGLSLNFPAFLTTARASNDAIGTNTANSNVTWTANSAGLSLDARGYAGTGTSATNASITLNSNGLAISVGAGGAGVTPVISAANGSYSFTTLSMSNANGISFGTSAGSAITASHNAITTGRASTDAIGLNTAQTNVTWTVNSSGLSLNAGGYAGTASGFTGANISGSITHNTAGLSLSLSVAAPGAAAENNAIQLLGANTAGNTTASGSTIGWSGVNVTLSGTNASQVVISAPATSSLVGTKGISISSAGSTISAMLAPAISRWDNCQGSHGGIQFGNGTAHFVPILMEAYGSFSRADMFVSASLSSSSNSSHAGTLSMAMGWFTRNGSTLSLASSGSVSAVWTNTSSNSQNNLIGVKQISLPINVNATPGDYWIGIWSLTSSANANWLTLSNVCGSMQNSAFSGFFGAVANASNQSLLGLGEFSASSATLANSYAFSDLRGTASQQRQVPLMQLINMTA